MKHYKWLIGGIAILILPILLVGCVSKSEYEALQRDYNKLNTKHTNLQTDYEISQGEQDNLQADYNVLLEEKVNLEVGYKDLQTISILADVTGLGSASIDPLTGLPLPTFPDKPAVNISDQIIAIPTGAVTGRILYCDKTPAYPCTVHLFDDTPFGTFSTAIDYTYTNEDGYYMFDSISSGVLRLDQEEWKVFDKRNYSIYPMSDASLTDYYSFPCFDSDAPHASVEISKHKLIVALDVFIPREE